jgi:sulfur carrier protein
MKVIINGQDKILEDNLSLKEIIQNLNIEDKVMACAVNMDIVKKESWSSYIPKDNDTIELLNFVGGGRPPAGGRLVQLAFGPTEQGRCPP